jgi:hypothetical protein
LETIYSSRIDFAENISIFFSSLRKPLSILANIGRVLDTILGNVIISLDAMARQRRPATQVQRRSGKCGA